MQAITLKSLNAFLFFNKSIQKKLRRRRFRRCKLATEIYQDKGKAGATRTDALQHILGIDGSGWGDLAARLGLVLRDLLSANQHSVRGHGKKKKVFWIDEKKAEFKFQLTRGSGGVLSPGLGRRAECRLIPESHSSPKRLFIDHKQVFLLQRPIDCSLPVCIKGKL